MKNKLRKLFGFNNSFLNYIILATLLFIGIMLLMVLFTAAFNPERISFGGW